jgi:hypothetical protein
MTIGTTSRYPRGLRARTLDDVEVSLTPSALPAAASRP